MSKKNKLIDIIIIVIMISCIFAAVLFYFQKTKDECTSNPLVFAAQLYEKNYDVTAYGTVNLFPDDITKQVTTIKFDSENYSVVE